jgi:hypothetical protein
MKRLIAVLGLLFSLVLMVPVGSTVKAETSPMQAANVPAQGAGPTRLGTAESYNWSGYAVTGSSATQVTGSWTVPSVAGSEAGSYSAAWVGIDGYSSATVEQTGTMQEGNGSNGSGIYYAWYEMYPNPMVQLSNPVKAGDNVTASVTYEGNNEFLLTITDTSEIPVWTYTNTLSAGTQRIAGALQDNNNPVENYDSQLFDRSDARTQVAARSSVEWIMEAPSSYSGVLPLADFGTISFSAASATISSPTSGTDPLGSIGSYTNNVAITMVTEPSRRTPSVLEATPSTLTAPNSFTVTWKAH